jgi:spore maturation protein A
MLNYIWAGLIIASLVFALSHDGKDIYQNRFRNGVPLPLVLKAGAGVDVSKKSFPVTAHFDPAVYRAHFGVSDAPAASFGATVERASTGNLLRFKKGESFPPPLSTIRDFHSPEDKELRGMLGELVFVDGSASTTLRFRPVRFAKLNAITLAAIDFAKTAVTLALGLVGALALWLGLVRIADESGLINIVVRLTRPVLRPLFPQVPPDHPAFGMITLNLAANVLGLGNAATPLGIKAMEQLQTLNPSKDTATNAMVMLLAINTASVQIVPPATLVAIMGLEAGRVFIPILIVTGLATVIAIIAVKLLGRLPGYRASDPIGKEG